MNIGSYDGLVFVDTLAQAELKWWISNVHQVNAIIHSRYNNNFGCVKTGLGWCMRQPNNQGQLIFTGTSTTHKRITELNLKHRTNISLKLRLGNTTAVAYINNKGGTRSPNLIALSLELWNWCVNRNIYIQAEHLPGIANVLADREWRQSGRFNLFATRLTHQLPRYASWHPDPKTYATDAFILNWATLKGYAFPPFNLMPRTLIKLVQNDKATILLLAPIWQGQTWWPPLLQLAIRLPVRLPSTPGDAGEPNRPTHDPFDISSSSSSRLAHFHVTRLLSAATRKSINKTYHCAWLKWCCWCDKRKIDSVSAGLKNILSFLGEQFENNLQCRTVNVFRSAISSVHTWIDGKPIEEHPLVIRLMKGIANERPPKSRYSTTWDVSKVTAYMSSANDESSLGNNNVLSLKPLSKKLAMLMVLIAPERSSVLADLDINFLRKQPDGFTFRLTKRRKTGDPTSLDSVSFPSLHQDISLPLGLP